MKTAINPRRYLIPAFFACLLSMIFLLAVPAKAYIRTDYKTLSVGQTATLRASLPSGYVYHGGGWYSTDPQSVTVTSDYGTSCMIKVNKMPSYNPVIVRCDLWYWRGDILMQGAVDVRVTVTESGGSGESGDYEISISPARITLDMIGNAKEFTVSCTDSFSDTVYLRYTSGNKVHLSNPWTSGKNATITAYPAAVGNESILFELCVKSGNTIRIVDKVYAQFTVTCSHRYDEGILVREPTETTEGLMVHICRYCGARDERPVPKLESGKCGDNLTWKLKSGGKLVISGSGVMWDWIEDDKWTEMLTDIVSVSVENGVTALGRGAFYKCEKLAAAELPSSLTTIGASAFYHCANLKEIVIPDNVNQIEAYAFCGCTGLKTLTLPEGITVITVGLAADCGNLESVSIPDSVEVIEGWSFRDCVKLRELSLPDELKSIGEYAFFCCTSLQQIFIPGESIGTGVFRNCTGLTEVSFSSDLTCIGEYAFYGCSGIKSLTIPDGVDTIGKDAFSECVSLAGITLPKSVASIADWAFSGCSQMKEAIIYSRNAQISDSAFCFCDELTIYGYRNSTAQLYACDNRIPFIPLDDDSSGDITISGTISSYGDPQGCITIRLLNLSGNEVKSVRVYNSNYTISAPAGTYLLEISKAKHVTRTYRIVLSENN